MTSRERVIAALDHKEPDRVPIDLGGTQVTTLTTQAYLNLRAYLELPPDPSPVLADRIMDVVYPLEDIHQRYQTDFRPIQLRMPDNFDPRENETDFYDEYGVHWRRASYYYDAIERPLTNLDSISEIISFPWPDPTNPGRVKGLRELAKSQFYRTDFALIADIYCLGPFEGACTLRGYDQFYVDLYEDPRYAQALLDKLTEVAIGFWDVFLNEVGDYVQIVAQGDDLGMQASTFISPAMIRKFVKPCLKRLYDFIRSKTKAKIFMHSCGSVYDILPDLIEIGVDILNPLQRSAAKMDIKRLKQEFGKDLSFWGGAIDVQQVFPIASLNEIEAEAKYSIEVLAPGGGYVFVPAHNIQPDVSPDRIDRLYLSALRYRNYPISSH
jgi:uroporphyrinogen decarboxylase